MTEPTGNVCIRCGKPRIAAKTWKEKTGNSTVTCTSFICPDPQCQQIVEKLLCKRQEEKETNEKQKAERLQASKNAAIARRRA